MLEKIVQLDEAYFGYFKKISLLMGKQAGERKLAYQILTKEEPNKTHAISFVKSYVKPGSQLYTDYSIIYRGIEKFHPITHTTDIHKNFEFKHTSEIEGMFGVYRTFIRRMYHHITSEKFESYLCEFYFRFCRPEMFKSPYHYLLNTLTLVPTG